MEFLAVTEEAMLLGGTSLELEEEEEKSLEGFRDENSSKTLGGEEDEDPHWVNDEDSKALLFFLRIEIILLSNIFNHSAHPGDWMDG